MNWKMKVKKFKRRETPSSVSRQLKNSSKKFKTDRQQASKKAKARIERLEKRRETLSEKVINSALNPVVDSLSVVQAMQEIQRVLRQDLGFQGVSMDSSIFVPVVEGILTVSLTRHILNANDSLPSRDKRAILDRVIARHFPDTPRSGGGKGRDQFLEQMTQMLKGPPQNPFGITHPRVPTGLASSITQKTGDR